MCLCDSAFPVLGFGSSLCRLLLLQFVILSESGLLPEHILVRIGCFGLGQLVSHPAFHREVVGSIPISVVLSACDLVSERFTIGDSSLQSVVHNSEFTNSTIRQYSLREKVPFSSQPRVATGF